MRWFCQGHKATALALCLLSIIVGGVTGVAAEPLGIGSTPAGTPSYAMALAIAKAVKEEAGLDVLPKPFKSTGQALPLVERGELKLGLSNGAELAAAWNGTGVFKDRAGKNIRLVARLFPFRLALAVRQDDPAQSLADLKTRTLPSGFTTTTTGEQLVAAMISTAGLALPDVKTVKVADFQSMRDAFLDRRTDVTVFIVGSGVDEELARKVGGVRLLELPAGAEADARIKAVLPVARTETVDPKDAGPVIDRPTRVMSYDFYLYAHEAAPAEAIKPLISALLNRKDTLVAAYPSYAWLGRQTIIGDIGLPYHAAAEEAYRELGLWPASP
ncbi:TAXI family TRAP transporter solute-binding subunit [Nordella sp. HKS 07]|uniref:TAXI family TRAP transporter solute-binding subunit n=1 Tax=Nordella sp. HKS 07 TaxID=2712222 RepID=UPI0013E1FE45|nr:TAXI family TRAP transporter solute-binding subunit [Nordella sp. HKS 07]QIG48479.1 TAXI family TRAP transporter solute-binding subunit [Nordella sp. HKS 07]